MSNEEKKLGIETELGYVSSAPPQLIISEEKGYVSTPPPVTKPGPTKGS